VGRTGSSGGARRHPLDSGAGSAAAVPNARQHPCLSTEATADARGAPTPPRRHSGRRFDAAHSPLAPPGSARHTMLNGTDTKHAMMKRRRERCIPEAATAAASQSRGAIVALSVGHGMPAAPAGSRADEQSERRRRGAGSARGECGGRAGTSAALPAAPVGNAAPSSARPHPALGAAPGARHRRGPGPGPGRARGRRRRRGRSRSRRRGLHLARRRARDPRERRNPPALVGQPPGRGVRVGRGLVWRRGRRRVASHGCAARRHRGCSRRRWACVG